MKLLISTALISTAMIATSAMAQQPLQESTPLNTVELNTIFDASQLENLQATELSNQEMKDTQGAMLPLALIYPMLGGAAFGVGVNTAITYAQTRELPTWQSNLFSAGTGALGGGYANVMLRGAGIATSPFASSAWQGTNGVANATIRVNGTMIGQSYSGIHKVNIPSSATRPTIPTYRPTTYANNLNTWRGALPIGFR